MEEEKNRIWSRTQEGHDQQRHLGFQEAIELIMETCTPPIRHITDSGHFELSVNSKQFLMSLIGKR